MPKIILEESFWATTTMTAYELFRYRNDKGDQESAECLGCIWGEQKGERQVAKCATVTQLIQKRSREEVIGPDPFSHALHNVWAARVAFGCGLLGQFHSHPWSEEEIAEYIASGDTDDVFHDASDEDKESMTEPSIEVILSCRLLTGVPKEPRDWGERGLVVSGEFDLAHITISGWYKSDAGVVSQVAVELPAAATINARIGRMNR